jgi:hypothetical protein
MSGRLIMKRCYIFAGVVFGVIANAMCADAGFLFRLAAPVGVVLSSPDTLPAGHVPVFQTNTAWNGGTGIQTRNRFADLSDWRGISQTFQWSGTDALDGIGLRFAADQVNWAEPQQYSLVLQQLDGAMPTSTIFHVEFMLGTNYVAANRWLYIDFEDVSLIDGQWYGFTLCPSPGGVSGAQRAYWAAADDGTHCTGRGAQWNPNASGLPKEDGYGSAGTDLTFYLHSVSAPSPWIFVGNEKEEVVDSETGRTVVYLTNGGSLDTHFHYHNGSWGTVNGRQYLFFSSSRERPVAAGVALPGERQIMAADIETGDLYYLTSIPNPIDGKIYYHRPYQASYNDDLKTVFFWGLLRHKLYAYNCITGIQTLLATLPSTHDSRELDDFVDADSVRLIYPVSDRANDLEYIEVADFDRNLNPVSRTVVRTSPVGDSLNHVEIQPGNKDVFFYKHHQEVGTPQYQAILKIADLESQQSDMAVNPNETPYVDHMIWGQSGDFIYWDDNKGTRWRFNGSAQTNEVVGGGSPIHNQISPDETLWVYDLRKDRPYFSRPFEHITLENWTGAIWIYDMTTDTSTKYANIIWASPHPRHPHAVFSPDGAMISFVTGMDNENSRVAIMRVEER